ncbi:MAG: glycerophosphodiester phosphodiesterase family protein [Pseudomonadota bacterium]
MLTEPVRSPMIIAHRGARTEAPENTAAAFDAALKYPIDGIEFDVQLSADNVPVIFHDDTLRRMTGSRRRLGSCALSELRALDFGGWFSPRFAGEPILTLEEMLQRYAGVTDLYLEIKSSPRDRSAGRIGALTRETLACVKRHFRRLSARRFHLLSFDAQALRLAHDLMPAAAGMRNLELPRGLTLAAATPERLKMEIDPGLTAVNLAVKMLSPALAAVVRGCGKTLFTYTCNTPRQLRRALAAGVDGVMTDKPDWLAQALAAGGEGACGSATSHH